MQLEGIDHVALGVRDIEQSVKWYIEVLGFERLHDGVWNGLFAQPDKTSLQRSANSKNAESNSNFKITRFRTPFIFAIPTATRSRSQPMNSPNHPDLSFRTDAPAKP